MLKGIPKVISPEFMKILMEMGHGDEICFADANFPATSNAQRLIRCDGHTVCELLEAVLEFFPLDVFVEKPCAVTQPARAEDDIPDIWEEYQKIIVKKDFSGAFKPMEKITDSFDLVERNEFYKRTQKCYAVVATSEFAPYGNIILTKGVIFE